jgi:hypothetical protein
MRPLASLCKNRTGASKIIMHSEGIRAETKLLRMAHKSDTSKLPPILRPFGAESASRLDAGGNSALKDENRGEIQRTSMIINEM